MVFQILEVWLYRTLVNSPLFHRAVRMAHKKSHEIRRGEKLHDSASTEGGGTNIDQPGNLDPKRFLKYYLEELKDQVRGSSKR